MLKELEAIAKKPRNKKIYNPMFSHEITFRPGAIETIRQAKGWKSDAEMARHIGVTRQYVSNLRKNHAYVTHTVIVRLAILLGNVNNNWWIYYEIVPSKKIKDINHPVHNLEKFNKQLPFSNKSAAYIRHKLVGKVEFQEQH